MVLPQMQAVLLPALERNTWTVHFRKAVGIINVHTEAFLDLSAGFLGVRFGADKWLAPCEIAPRVNAVFFEEGREVERVAGREVDERRPKILHQHQLPLGIARSGGDDEAADFL